MYNENTGDHIKTATGHTRAAGGHNNFKSGRSKHICFVNLGGGKKSPYLEITPIFDSKKKNFLLPMSLKIGNIIFFKSVEFAVQNKIRTELLND